MFHVLSHQGNRNRINLTFHFTPNRGQKLKKQHGTRMWSNGDTPAFLVGMQPCATTLEISLAVSQKIRNSSTWRRRSTAPGHALKRCSPILHANMLHKIHSSITHNIQKMETQMSLTWRIDTDYMERWGTVWGGMTRM